MIIRRYTYNFFHYVVRIQRQRFRYSRYGFWRQFNWRSWFKWRPSFLVALSAGFSFENFGISDEVMEKEKDSTLNHHPVNRGWEVIVKRDDILVVKREREDTGLNEYCCSGSYRDISARDFIDAQMNLEYRCKWDTHVIKLEILDEDEATDTQVIRWISKYPYPLYPREYIFVRRRHFDEENNCVTIVSASLDEEAYPSSSDEYVRVTNYHSVMVVSAHSSFDEKGFNYVLSYRDDPGGNIPKYVYNWLVNSGGPNFLKEVHEAARRLESARLKRGSMDGFVDGSDSEKQTDKSTDKEGTGDSFGLLDFFFLQRLFSKDSHPKDLASDSEVGVTEVLEHSCGMINGADHSANCGSLYGNSGNISDEEQLYNNSVTSVPDDKIDQIIFDENSKYSSDECRMERGSILVDDLVPSPEIWEGTGILSFSSFLYGHPHASSVSDLLKLVE